VSVLVFGLNYRTAPISLLERLAVPAERLPKALKSLTDRDDIAEAVVLSTCNRVEVYAHVARYHGAMQDLRNFFAEWSGAAPEDFAGLAYDYYDDRAASHLFAVTSGLDSMVVGERQIQLQVKQAFRDAEAEGSCGRVLQSLFRRALRVGRRTRVETGISAGASSMVDVGLDAAERVLADLDGSTALIVGAGKMGGMAANRLAGRAGHIIVANRSLEKRARLAEKVGGDELDLADLTEGLRRADYVMASTGAAQPVVDAETVAAVMAGRPDRPLVLLDLAVPRDIDPACADIPGVTVLDIDTIRALTDTGRTGEEVAKARAVVEAEAEAFAAWTRTVRVEPTISALRDRAEQVRSAELERLAGRLGDLDERQRDAVEALTRGIVNTLLHEPSIRLKQIADQRGAEQQAAALRELFDLPPELG
jgi:glutamyl-tRNA reductase